MVRCIVALSILLFTAVSAGNLLAAEDEGSLFDQLDRNGDGVVVAEELEDSQQKYFERLLRVADRNDDEKIDRAEFRLATTDQPPVEPNREPAGGGPGRMFDSERLLANFDRNRDGLVQYDELPEMVQERMEPLFRAAGKRELSLEDLEQVRRRFQAGMQRPMQQRPSSGLEMVSEAPRSPAVERIMGTLDRNRDQVLTTIEMELAPARLLALDRNRNGVLEPEELSGP